MAHGRTYMSSIFSGVQQTFSVVRRFDRSTIWILRALGSVSHSFREGGQRTGISCNLLEVTGYKDRNRYRLGVATRPTNTEDETETERPVETDTRFTPCASELRLPIYNISIGDNDARSAWSLNHHR